jgi:alpha-beta hydrolase superfamily lysophospholipase
MTRDRRFSVLALAVALVALVAVVSSLWTLNGLTQGLRIEETSLDGIPVTVYRPSSGENTAPAIVIAHGFSGSQQLMQPFATTFARNGYTAVTFDFAGHGRNARPLSGNITRAEGATRTLLDELTLVANFARGLGDGRTGDGRTGESNLGVLGHSMASDIVVRFSQRQPDVPATVAVSLFSPAVRADSPRNLLVISGAWESRLRREALRAVGLGLGSATPEEGRTYGEFSDGTARRAAVSASVEHVGVLYSQDSMREAVAWIDAAFGQSRTAPYLDRRGPLIGLLLGGVILLAWPLSRLLPMVSRTAAGAGLPWRRLWLPVLLPPILTPLLLRVLPTHFLPVLVADYLAAHFAMYGALTFVCLAFVRRGQPRVSSVSPRWRSLAVATLAVLAFYTLGLVLPIDAHVTSFLPGAERTVLVLALLVGTLAFTLADEWLTRGQDAGKGERAGSGAYAVTKLAFLLSLGLAVALDLPRLFFLLIILPVIVPFLLVLGLFSFWIYRRTRHPFVAGIANAALLAFAIGVTFPLLAG